MLRFFLATLHTVGTIFVLDQLMEIVRGSGNLRNQWRDKPLAETVSDHMCLRNWKALAHSLKAVNYLSTHQE